MKTVVFHVVGESPILMHSTKGMVRQPDKPAVTTGKKIPSAKDEAEMNAYRDDSGTLYIPCIAFRQALVSAGKNRKIGKQFATTLLKGSVMDRDRRSPLVHPATGEIIAEYEIDQRSVVISSARVMRARPRIEFWAAEVPLDYDEDQIDPDIIEQFLKQAGIRVGVLDYRVEKGGWFGRFAVTGFVVNGSGTG